LDLTTVTDLMIFEEIFLDRVYPLEKVSFTPDVVIDGGACTGCFTLLAHARYPNARFIAIEPEPNNFARLERHLRDNGITAQCHAAALAGAPGKVMFTGSGFGGHITSVGSAASGFQVPAVSLNELIQAAAPTRLLLKLDVEGMEQEILPRLAVVLPPTTAILLETHHPEAECQRYMAPLISSGFASCVIRSRPAPTPAMAYVERLLVRVCA
jgi:FkbM family methyltransferase